MVWASYNSAGHLAVVWRDRRNGADTGFFQPTDIYCAISHDNGATFSKNIRLSAVTTPFDSILMQKGNDFMCNSLVGDSIYVAWGSVNIANDKLNIYFAKTSDSTGVGTGVITVSSESLADFTCYPNPATDMITVSLLFEPGGLQLVINITDLNGKLIRKEKVQSQKTTVNLHGLANGTYFVTVEGEEISLPKKVVKIDSH